MTRWRTCHGGPSGDHPALLSITPRSARYSATCQFPREAGIAGLVVAGVAGLVLVMLAVVVAIFLLSPRVRRRRRGVGAVSENEPLEATAGPTAVI